MLLQPQTHRTAAAFTPPSSGSGSRLLAAKEDRVLHLVMAEAIAWKHLQGKGDSDGIIERSRSEVPDAKGDGRCPVPQIAIDRVVLFFHGPIAGFVIVGHPPGPVFI